MDCLRQPLHLAFLGCGFITGVHSRHLRSLRPEIICSYASRDKTKADAYCGRFGGRGVYGSYRAALDDPRVDAVVVAVPPQLHLQLTLEALHAGKHVLVEKPAFLSLDDYRTAIATRDRQARVVLVGEND